MKNRFVKWGLEVAVYFILMLTFAELLVQTYLMLAFVLLPDNWPGFSVFLDAWFVGMTDGLGDKVASGSFGPLLLILLSIIAITLLELKLDEKPAVI